MLIVEDHELVRAGLRLRIEQQPDLKCCGEAASESEARQILGFSDPDVAVVDVALQDGNGIDLIKWARRHKPELRTIVLTAHDEHVYGERALQAGAKGYVYKAQPAETIIDAIRAVQTGKMFFGEELTARMLRIATKSKEDCADPMALLSNRELSIFGMLGKGLPSGEIAKQLNLSRSTVDTYRERIKIKLEIQNASELLRRAFEWQHGQS